MSSIQTRTFHAEVALNTYLEVKGENEDGDASIIDLISDLLHLAQERGYDVESVKRCASMHVEHEADLQDATRDA